MQPRDPYLDTCLLLSLLVPDSGSSAALHWLASQHSGPIWLSHWTWLEFTGVLAVCCRRGNIGTERLRAIHGEADALRRERLSLVEPSSVDFLQAQQWLQQYPQIALRSADALHLAIAQRHGLRVHTADQALLDGAQSLDCGELVLLI